MRQIRSKIFQEGYGFMTSSWLSRVAHAPSWVFTEDRSNHPFKKSGGGNLAACIIYHVIMSVDPVLNFLKEK
jgi:hypothetical protein